MASGYNKNGTQEAANGMYVVERLEDGMKSYWDGGQVAGTLSVKNACGGQRMPDKQNFNCVVMEEPTPDINRGIAGTLDGSYYKGCGERQGIEREIVTSEMEDSKYVVRRLTPTECARLQGFPDHWGWPDVLEDMDEETFEFWKTVRQTHDSINGRKPKEYTKKQILTWYNKLHTDSAEYKMWGNGIALPTALYVMQGIADELEKTND